MGILVFSIIVIFLLNFNCDKASWAPAYFILEFHISACNCFDIYLLILDSRL